MVPRIHWTAFALAVLNAPASVGSAAVIVRFVPQERIVSLGQQFQVKLMADIPAPVVGWGLDVSYDGQLLSTNSLPTIGPLWSPGYAPDGDGLVGLAFPNSIAGSDLLLATLTFEALSTGETALTAGITPGDLTEGFPLDPAGFDAIAFEPARVTVVPDPACLLFMSLGTLIAYRPRSPHLRQGQGFLNR